MTFVRAAIVANDAWITYTAPLGRRQTFPRTDLSRVVVGRPIMGIVGRPPRIVFESRDGTALIALDPAMWAPADVAHVAGQLNIPVQEWPVPGPRSLARHVLRFAAAGLALAITIAAVVTTVAVLVSH